jgi:peptidoglycan glycosyltransferase
VNLTQAIAKSCNTAFVELGSDLNKSKLRELADDLLFNQKISIDISSKKSSFTVTRKTKKNQMPQIVIGQGDTLITPLNNALIMCAIANDGVIMKPYLADHIENYNGGVIKQYEPSKLTQALSSSEAQAMKEMLKSVISDGTGSILQTSAYTVAGKTGSAEYNSKKDSHAWFVGMSNVEDPDLVVSVIVEQGGSGGKTAAPIAKKVFDSFYNNGLND